MPKLFINAILVSVFFFSFTEKPVYANTELTKKLDALVDKAVSENLVVGAVILVLQDGKTIYKRACGYADREQNTKMKLDAIFRLASMSKSITAACVLCLVKDNLIKLDEPVTKYLPYFHPKTADGKEVTITIAQLINHTSGLGYPFIEGPGGQYHKANICDGLSGTEIKLDDNLKNLAALPLLFDPGKSWHYSLGFEVLGAVVEMATQKPLSESINNKIAAPLKMKDLVFYINEKRKKRLVAAYYNSDNETRIIRMTNSQFMPYGRSGFVFDPDRALNKNAYQSGSAGLNCTAVDYMRFLEALRQSKKPLQNLEMQRIRSQNFPISIGPGWSYGYAGAILVDPVLAKTPQSKGTLMWGGAWGHNWFVDPEKKLSVLCLTNTAPSGIQGQFPDSIRDTIYDYLAKSKVTKKGKVDATEIER